MEGSIEVLNFARAAQMKRRWLRLWMKIGYRILKLPKREQDILLQDFETAIENRILVMERINDAKRRNRNR